jgi:hypothetical protein
MASVIYLILYQCARQRGKTSTVLRESKELLSLGNRNLETYTQGPRVGDWRKKLPHSDS